MDFTPNDSVHRPATMAAFRRAPHPDVAADLDAFIGDHWGNLGARAHLECSPYRFVFGALYTVACSICVLCISEQP